jgi:hypothetical protein
MPERTRNSGAANFHLPRQLAIPVLRAIANRPYDTRFYSHNVSPHFRNVHSVHKKRGG